MVDDSVCISQALTKLIQYSDGKQMITIYLTFWWDWLTDWLADSDFILNLW